jgi:hypothetical protein
LTIGTDDADATVGSGGEDSDGEGSARSSSSGSSSTTTTTTTTMTTTEGFPATWEVELSEGNWAAYPPNISRVVEKQYQRWRARAGEACVTFFLSNMCVVLWWCWWSWLCWQ